MNRDDHSDSLAAGVASGVRKALDSHGFSFQQRVIREADRLYGEGSKWLFEAAEIPVLIRGESTRIDFLLRRRAELENSDAYLVAECKRANPRLGRWCFATTPYIRRDQYDGTLLFDTVIPTATPLMTKVKRVHGKHQIYNLGLELRRDVSSDEFQSTSRGAIEQASGQVIRGLNGFVQLLGSETRLIAPVEEAVFVPVVFTTASIWVTDADVAGADLETGALPAEEVRVRRQPWIWYRYHFSPGMKHTQRMFVGAGSVGEFVETGFARTIAIVSSTGISDFLCRQHW